MPFYRCFCDSKSIPLEYSECRYIRFVSANKAYIVLPTISGSNIGASVRFDVDAKRSKGNHVISGCVWGVARSDMFLVYYSGNEYYAYDLPGNIGEYTYQINTPSYPNQYHVDGPSSSVTGDITVRTITNGKVTIGAYSAQPTSTTYNFTGKFYWAKYYNGTDLILDLVPALRKSDSKIGVYDRITKTFFSTSGGTVYYEII